MTTQKDDALAVLGEDGQDIVDQLESAKTKTETTDVLVKADDDTTEVEETDVDETETQEEVVAETAETETDEIETTPETPETVIEPEPKSNIADEMRAVLGNFVTELGKSIDERLAALEKSIPDQIAGMQAQIDALAADETEKVKAAIDGDGEWYTRLARTVRDSSVQRERAVEDGTRKKGPVESGQWDKYRSQFTPPPNKGE